MNKKVFATAASAALLVGAGQAVAATVIIDTFDTEQTVFDKPAAAAGLPQGSEVAASEAIGGYRDLYVQTLNGGSRVGATSLVASSDPLDAADGILSFNNEDGVTGRGWVTYDGMDGDASPDAVNIAGLGGRDFQDGPGAGFFFDVVRVDAQLYIEIRAFDTFGEESVFAGSVIEGGTPFAPLTAFSNADFDWNSVGALQFFAQSGPDSDVISLDGAISSISVETGVIPLPASALLLLGGLGGLSAFGIRRKRS